MTTADKRRRGLPYIWPTWIAGLIAGEAHCQWRAWYKAHFRYEKAMTVRSDENALDRWKAEHAAAVRRLAESQTAAGASVFIEDQNRFTYEGRAAIVGACPDLVAVRSGSAVVVDVKTGRERAADFFQVAIYLVLAPLVPGSRLRGLSLSGVVAYAGRNRDISADDAEGSRDLVISQVLLTAGRDAPLRVPSVWECRRCDIAACPDRAADEDAAVPVPPEEALF